MPKKKAVEIDVPFANSMDELGGESPKKKKKRKRKRSEGQEEEEEELALNLSLSSFVSSSESSPSKKKKKKKRKSTEEDLLLETTVNGLKEEEEEEEETKKKKKKKKRRSEEEEEVKIEIQAEAASKKKKKRKKEEEEEEEKAEEEESPRKKKKKKKKGEKLMKKKEEEEEEEEEVKTKKEKKKTKHPPTTTPTTTSSPSKGRRKTEMEEEEDEEEEEEEEEDEEMGGEEQEESVWSKEATLDLLQRVTQQLPQPDKDNRSCRVTLKGVDWGAAAPPGHSPEATRDHFMGLYKKISPFKSLTTVVGEMGRLVESGLKDRRNRPLMPIHRFMKEYLTPEKQAAAKRKGENIFRLGHEAWKNLPEAKKERYTKSYMEDCARLQSKAEKKPEPPVKLPKLPHQLCWDAGDHATPAGRSRSHYTSLSPARQLPYIRQALEDVLRYQGDLETHLASHPDYKPPPCPALPKADLKTYLDAYGCPEMPPPRPTQLFYRELLEKGALEGVVGTNKMAIVMKRFKELDPQEKLLYKERLAQRRQEYEDELKEWVKGQDEVSLSTLKKYQEMCQYNASKMMPKDKTCHVKVDKVFPFKAPAVLTSCPKFLGEPPRPVASPYRLFALKFRSSTDVPLSGPNLQRALKDGWKALTKDEVEVYASRCRLLHKEYEKEVKAYVREMDPKNRRLYLGFHRLPLFRFFSNRDVFAEEFPNGEDYPVFVKGLKPPENSPSKPQDEESEDEEEEDEVRRSPKKVKLSPVLFTSLKSPPSPANKGSGKGSKQPPKASAPSQKKTKAPPPPLSESEEEEEEVDVENVPPAAQPKQKSRVVGVPVTVSKKAKQQPPPPESEEEEEEEEEEEVAPASRVVGAPVAVSKKAKQPPAPVESESEEEEEEEVAPAWHSPHVAQPRKQPKQQQQDESSSSGFSDSDSD